MAALAFELLLRFLWGSSLILFWISRKETSERFLRVAFWISLGVSVSAALLGSQAWPLSEHGSLFYRAIGSMFLFSAGVFLYSFFVGRLFRILGFLCSVGSPLLFWESFSSVGESFNFFSSSLLLGSVFMGQFLGHWYLNVPNLHIRELKRVAIAMVLGVLIKSGEIVYTLFVKIGVHPEFYKVDALGRPLGYEITGSTVLDQISGGALFDLQGEVAFGLGSYGLLLLATRVLWGALAPLILSGLVYQTVKMRSTQSATGILYAMCVMVLIGEASALYFKNVLGILL